MTDLEQDNSIQTTVTGKTVDEALAKAVAELGAPDVASISYTVLEEPKKGLFGIGATPAKIVASYTPEKVTSKEESVALDFVKRLIADMGIEADVTMSDKEDGGKLISIDGESAGALIGHHGDTLDALQYLTGLAANNGRTGDDYTKISVDVGGYRAKREDTLRALARRRAEQVLKFKKSVMLEPMNPYERRIIHSEIQKMEGVSTNSIGSENNRKVVIYLDPNKKAE